MFRRRRQPPASWREEAAANWRAALLSTEPADRAAAEAAVGELYRLHRLPPPVFVWTDSPLSGLLVSFWAQWTWSGSRESLVEELHSAQGWARLPQRIRDSVGASVGALLDAPPPFWKRPQYLAKGRRVVETTGEVSARLHGVPGTRGLRGLRMRAAVARVFGASSVHPGQLAKPVSALEAGYTYTRRWFPHGSPLLDTQPVDGVIRRACAEGFEPFRYGGPYATEAVYGMMRGQAQLAAEMAGELDACRRAGLARYPGRLAAVLDPVIAAARSCWTWWPSARHCTMVERPVRLVVDWPAPHRPRPHCADGPAIAWRDGWDLYAWRGVLVPRGVIDGAWTAEEWLAEPNAEVRRAVAERLGYERLLDARGARRVATDGYGTLWRIPDPNAGEDITLVDVMNSTPEPDGSVKRYVLRVPPDQTVPRDAIGWTFGLPPGAYDPDAMT
ncbi:hypothetical protein RB614_35085 [Phytohabitans sp. ZYX-F-186]|uniref:DUF6745 domain-containing protein n=1 Tax=Phytohabitans maris TaxID=3071409 RepID=A0ABU0ZTX2_9ACTN|nr:hypothetical protein [Phytohabitans sp. ZYX-F-186]MDQ7909759.1 hypothetical protein [Phytohabitans sp. ZYX-F-186]